MADESDDPWLAATRAQIARNYNYPESTWKELLRRYDQLRADLAAANARADRNEGLAQFANGALSKEMAKADRLAAQLGQVSVACPICNGIGFGDADRTPGCDCAACSGLGRIQRNSARLAAAEVVREALLAIAKLGDFDHYHEPDCSDQADCICPLSMQIDAALAAYDAALSSERAATAANPGALAPGNS